MRFAVVSVDCIVIDDAVENAVRKRHARIEGDDVARQRLYVFVIEFFPVYGNIGKTRKIRRGRFVCDVKIVSMNQKGLAGDIVDNF